MNLDLHPRVWTFPLWLAAAAISVFACQIISPGSATSAPTGGGHSPTATPAATLAVTPAARRAFSVGAAAGPSFLAPAAARGAKVALDESQLPFLILFPELRGAPAPNWLKPGARVTYQVASATIAQAPGQQGASGSGFAQYDLVAIDNGLAVAISSLFLDSGSGNAVVPSLVFPVLGLPGIGEFWLNPQALVKAEDVATPDLAVTRMDQDFGGDTYHGVRFQYTHATATYAWVYDSASGVLLFYSAAIGSDTDPNRQLTQVTFAARRQLSLPWHAGSLPGWVAQTRHLHYSGTYATTVSGASTVELSAAADVQFQDHFNRWNAYRLSSSIQGQPDSASEQLTGGDEVFGGLWLAPEALAALQDGQTLDTDPVTGAVTTVTRDQTSVTLTETGQLYQTSLSYDAADGRLTAIVQQQQVGLATIVNRLQLDASH